MCFKTVCTFISFTKSSKLVVELEGSRIVLSIDLPVILENIHLVEGSIIEIGFSITQDRYFNTSLKCLKITSV